MGGEIKIPNQPLPEILSGSKVLLGQKRGILEMDSAFENSPKRVKMRDLESVFLSEAELGKGESKTVLDHNYGRMKSRSFDLNLDAEDNCSSINSAFYLYKNCEKVKSRNDSDCGSSVGPLNEKDYIRAWNEIKQNNYMSSANRTLLPVPIPKPRGRKKKNSNDEMNKRIELARKEKVDKFARLAAPTGLLNGLNPGIINHVRNSKQVHSIIEALLKSERDENRHVANKHGDQMKNGAQEIKKTKETKDICSLGDTLLWKRQIGDYGIDGFSEDPKHWLNKDDVTSDPVKAANVAAQWLELLNQDIKGRLAALRRSKRRACGVIKTELPLLISKEFSSDTDKATVDAHSIKWRTLFCKMAQELLQEENRLESWLSQVKELQLHCDNGLHRNCMHQASKQLVATHSGNRLKEMDKSINDLAIMAAAASIYSTCNFLPIVINRPIGEWFMKPLTLD